MSTPRVANMATLSRRRHWMGHEVVVQLLVDRGADVNAQGGDLRQCSPGGGIGWVMRRWSSCWWIKELTSTPRAANTATLSRRRQWRGTRQWSSC
jgi:hypothetical protein